MSGPPKIIIAGAPASGKGTQCEFIKKEYGCVHLSTGDMLRDAVKAGSDLGKEAKGHMDSGGLVPDRLIIDIIIQRLADEDCVKRGWLLDGFPRTRAQADALASAGLTCDCFLLLDVPDNLLVERVCGRRSDPETGQIYHIKYKPPETPEIAARLTQRSDDTEEAIMVRVKNFHANVASIMDAYKDNLIRFNGARDPKIVWADIQQNIPRACKLDIVLTLGSPGCGRKALSAAVAAAVNAGGYNHINTGAVLRASQDDAILASIAKGALVPAQTVAALIKAEISKKPNCKKWLLDGFARTVEHVSALHDALGGTDAYFIDTALYFETSEDACRAALSERAGAGADASVDSRLQAFSASNTSVLDLFRSSNRLRTINVEGGLHAHPAAVARKASSLLRAGKVIPPYERTFAMIKPDAVGNGSVGAILEMIAKANLSVIFTKLVSITDAAASSFYGEHNGKPFFAKLKQFMTSAPAVVMVLEGTNAIKTWRTLLGPTSTQKAMSEAPESIRAKFGTDGTQNAAHGSDSPISAAREIDFWTNPSGLGATCPEQVITDADGAPAPSASLGIPVQDTFAMIKPGTSDFHYEEIMDCISGQGFTVCEELKTRLTLQQACAFYAEHEGKGFYDTLTKYMSSGPIVALHLRKEFAIGAWRHLIGPTNFEKAKKERPDSLRARFAMDGTRNACHGSDSDASARRELSFFFSVGGAQPSLYLPPLGQAVPAAFNPVSVADEASVIAAAAAAAATPAGFVAPKRYASKVRAVPTISIADLTLMEAYANYEVDPIMKELLQRLMVTRPEDVSGFALQVLAELHGKAGKALPTLSTGLPVGGPVILAPIISPRSQPGAGAL